MWLDQVTKISKYIIIDTVGVNYENTGTCQQEQISTEQILWYDT
jgi:hypothetical protein